ncbi:MAG: hypothetical protein ABI416_14780 [Ginsengibacter sp.]
MKKFIVLAVLLVLTRIADLQTTYLSTSDVGYEFNPQVLRMGWDGLV